MGDLFGYSVSISGDTVVVGAYRDDDVASSSGSAHVYRFDGGGWSEPVGLLSCRFLQLYPQQPTFERPSPLSP